MSAISMKVSPASDGKYSISVLQDSKKTVKAVERTTDEVVKLSSDLGVEFSEMIIPQYNSARDSNTEQQKVSDDIEKYFTSINSYLGEDVLRSPAFLKFFDEELMQFPLLSLQLDLMAKKINAQQNACMDYEQRLLSQETQTSVIFDKILQMEKLLGPHFLEYMSTDASPSSSLRINPKLPSTCDFNNNLHSRNNSITNPSGLRSASTTGGRTSFNTNNDDSAHSILDVHSAISIGGVVPGKIGKQLDIDDVSCDNTTALSSPENRLSTASDLAPAITSSTGSPFSKQRKSMTVAKVNLMEDFMKLNSEESVGNNSQQSSASLFSGFIDGLIDAIQPHETQLLYRASVIAWIRRQIRKCINCTAIEMSFHELRCFLPDDPIKLSLILCKGRMTNWHTMIIDRLNYLAERAIQCGPTYNILAEEDIADYHFDEPCPLVNHVFHHVGFVNGNTGSNINGNSTGNLKICLHVDSSVEVEIGTNQRAEAALLAFYQEFADLVGKNQLFKRSLLLVRSWWFYETAAYIGSTIKSYLTESTLTMMVVAIFNQHHKQLLTPLHVLVMFLVEYCDYDGANNVITLQGVVPLKEVAVSSTNNISGNPNAGPTFIPELNLVSPEHLINDELIDKYSEILNIPHDQDESNAANEFLMLRTTSSEDVDMDNAGSSIVNSSSMSNLSPTKVNSPDSKFFGQESQFNNRNETMPPFEKNGFNVLNPFNNSNMVLEKLSNRRLSKIAKAFQIGTANLSAVLRQGLDTLGAAPIIGFFPVIKSRFVDNWRPDAISNSIERNLDLRLPSGYEEYEKKYDNPRDILVASLEKLWLQMQYCNLVLENVVTELPLILLTKEILAEKGALPVGEIGKVLTEYTSIPNLSMKLKEIFGGLKKFLEMYTDRFVILNDHPFNPHVVLRSALTPQQLEMFERGIFPTQIVIKSKKANATKRKKAFSLPGSTPDPKAPTTPNSGNAAYTSYTGTKYAAEIGSYNNINVSGGSYVNKLPVTSVSASTMRSSMDSRNFNTGIRNRYSSGNQVPNVANEQAVSPLRRIFEGSYLPAQQSLPAAVSYNNYNNAGSMYSNAGNTNSAMRSSNIREYPEDIYRNSHDQSLHVRQTQEYFEGSHKLGTGIGMSGIGVNSNVIPMTTRKSIGDSSSEYLVDALLGPSASNYDNHYLSPGRMSFNDLYEKSNTNDNSLIHERRKSDPSLGVNMLNSGATFSPGDLFNQFASRDPPSQMNYSNIAPDGYSGQLGLFSAGNSSVLESTDQLDIFNVAKGNSLSRK